MSVYFGTYKDSTKIRFLLYGNFYSPTCKHLVVGFSNRIEIWNVTSDNALKKMFSYKVVGMITGIAEVKLRPTDEVSSLAVLTVNRTVYIYSVGNDYSCKESALKAKVKAQLDPPSGMQNPHGVTMFAVGDKTHLVIHAYPAIVDYLSWTYNSRNDCKFQSSRHKNFGKVRDIGQLGGEHFKDCFLIIHEYGVTNMKAVVVKKGVTDLVEDDRYSSFEVLPDYLCVVPYKSKTGGCIVFGKFAITAFFSQAAFRTNLDKTYGKVKYVAQFKNPNTFLVFTSKGTVGLLELVEENGVLESFDFDVFATVNVPHCIARLEGDKFFITGELCDHSLVEFVENKMLKTTFTVKILNRLLNSSPILDALAIEDRCDRRLIMSTSSEKDGKLLIIKDGMKLKTIVSMACPVEPVIYPLKDVEGKKSLFFVVHNDEGYYLSVSPDSIFLKSQNDVDDLPRFNNLPTTHYICCFGGRFFLQMTTEFFVILSVDGEVFRGPGSAAGHSSIGGYVAVSDDDTVTWYRFDQDSGKADLVCSQKFPEKVQAVKFVDPENPECTLCVVSLYSGGKFFLVDMPETSERVLRIVQPFLVPGEVFTDAMLCRFGQDNVYLLISTDLGKLEHFLVDEKTGRLRAKKPIHVGVRPLKFRQVRVKGQLHLLICSDQVSVMRFESSGLTFCHLDVRCLNSVYNLDSFENVLLYHRDNELCVGIIPGKQTKSFVPIPIGESIERLIYNENTNLIVAVTSNSAIVDPGAGDVHIKRSASVVTAFEMAQMQAPKLNHKSAPVLPAKYRVSTSTLVAFDGDRYVPIGVINMPIREVIACIASAETLGKNYILVGTGIVEFGSDVCTNGRLLLYEVARPALDSNVVFNLLAEKSFDGCVMGIKVTKSNVIRLLADSATKEVVLDDSQQTFDLKTNTTLGNYVSAVSVNWNAPGDLLIFSDVLNPTSLVKFYEDAPQERLTSSAELRMTMTVDFLNRHQMVAFDARHRLHLLSDQVERVTNRDTLENMGAKLFHLGSCYLGYTATVVRKGRPFVPIFYKNMSISSNSRYYATNCGAIGVLSLVEPTVFRFLKEAEKTLSGHFSDEYSKPDSPFLNGDYLSRMLQLSNVEEVFREMKIPDGIETEDLPNYLVVFKYARELWRLHL